MQRRFVLGGAPEEVADEVAGWRVEPPPPDSGREPVFTIGHSTRSWEAFVELVDQNGIRALVDARSLPRSRRLPQFDRDSLSSSLRARGFDYRHDPRLGGFRHRLDPGSPNTAWHNASFRAFADHMGTAEFGDGLRDLFVLRPPRPTAIMCAEAVPWRCHRSLISDALLLRRVPVYHILGPRTLALHRWPSFARGTPDGRVIYPGPPRSRVGLQPDST